MKPVRTITFVARHTGLSVHTIRVWERRYGAVRPVRADNKRRLYSEQDVERLRLLRQATQAGHTIGQIARSSAAELRRLLRDEITRTKPPRAAREQHDIATDLFTASFRAVKRLDANDLSDLLDRAAVTLGSPAVLHRFVAPLAEQVGEKWRAGELNVAHEHFATGVLSAFLMSFARPYPSSKSAPHLVVATPTGQLHELGAIIAAAAARSHGWHATYLGASLPIEELIGAATSLKARAIGLSLVFPPDDEALVADLRKFPKLLPPTSAAIFGGRSSGSYVHVIAEIGGIRAKSLEELYPILDSLHQQTKPAAGKRAAAKAKP
jgi:DNA-binding transcriptional MerR regulator